MTATLIVGDVHLGRSIAIGKPGVGSAFNSRIADQFFLLDWILDQALENNVNCIIFTGDICEDVKPDYILMTFFIEWLKKCEVNNIDIHIVIGNHDIKRTGSHYVSALDIIQSAEISNTFVYKEIETIYNGNVGFTLLPFKDRRSFNYDSTTQALDRIKEMLLYESSEIPDTYDKVLVGHLAIEGSIIVGDEFDDTVNELMCPANMFINYNYTWMGHVHRPQVRSKIPYVAHIGSLDISDFGETDHQKILVLFDPNLLTKFKEIKVPSRPLRRIRLSIPSGDTTQIILNEIENLETSRSFKNAIVKIEIQLIGSEVSNAKRNIIEEKIYELGAHYICNFAESRSTTVIPLEKKTEFNNTINPKSAIKMYADYIDFNEDDKKEFINLCSIIVEECN